MGFVTQTAMTQTAVTAFCKEIGEEIPAKVDTYPQAKFPQRKPWDTEYSWKVWP